MKEKEDVPSLAPTQAFASFKPEPSDKGVPSLQPTQAFPTVTSTGPAAGRFARMDSIDILRGVIMVIMALDHTRDFTTAFRGDPTNLEITTPAYFITRWITHFCAPVFMFFAGTGAWLSLSRGKSKADLSRFLFTRGLWLVFVEFTITKFGWDLFNYDPRSYFLIVIWALGVGMIVLSAMIHLPLRAIVAISALFIVGHNFLDPISPQAFGSFAWLWHVLHVPGVFGAEYGQGWGVFVGYPLIPWVFVMSMGYAFGSLLTREDIRSDASRRRSMLLKIGLSLTLAFVVLRAINVVGESWHWSVQKNALFTMFSFVNTSKYPPSLLYLLMTLGPAIAALAFLDKARGRIANFFLVFGRVPLFFYILHIPFLNAMGWILYYRAKGTWPTGVAFFGIGSERLAVVYLVWAVGIALLYPLCRWYMNLKARSKNRWLSYL